MIVPVPFQARETQLSLCQDYSVGEFFAMGCHCELLMETTDKEIANSLLTVARNEAWRLEALWSRYLPSSLVQRLNTHPERAVDVDVETAAVIEYCKKLWELSDGAFDITSGVLRKVWTFDGSCAVPSSAEVAQVLQRVGWQRVQWDPPTICMQPGMQIDFGGVGKEYAVDRCSQLLEAESTVSCLVNFGGDCAVSQPAQRPGGWQIGVERAAAPGQAQQVISLETGAIATSGSTYRYRLHEGKRLSHIMDARTGWPVASAPAAITVSSSTCLEAGMLATLACLQGEQAREFLSDAGVRAVVQD